MTGRELTIVFPHFCNLGMLAEQQRVWADYPKDLRSRLHVIVVDDCSPDGAQPSRESVTVSGLASFRICRLLKKQRWNWLACRNLGAKLATTDWLLLTDIDHVVPASTLSRLLDGPLDPSEVYRFKRVTAGSLWPYDPAAQPAYKPHNDTWCLPRAMFFDPRVFGYDERLSGCYGTSAEFKDRLVSVALVQVLLNESIVRYPREVIPDASTDPSVYTRKNDPENDAELRRRKDERAQVDGWKPLHGLTPFEEVYSSREQVPC